MSKFKYETRNAAGQVCCAGNAPTFHRCPACKPQPTTAAARPVTRTTAPAADFTPPNPYEKGINELRVREAHEAARRTPRPTARPTYDALLKENR